MKRVIVACGSGVATSQTVAFKIMRMFKEAHINDAYVEAINIKELDREIKNSIAYIEIMKSDQEFEVPKINGLAFLSGKGKEEEFEKLLQIIKESKQEEKYYEKSYRCMW